MAEKKEKKIDPTNVLKEMLALIQKNDIGQGLMYLNGYIVPIGKRGQMFICPEPDLAGFIDTINEVEKLFSPPDKSEEDVILLIEKILMDPVLKTFPWKDLLSSDEEKQDFYNGGRVVIELRLHDEDRDIVITKSLLPKGMKKGDFDEITYATMMPENNFILRKHFPSKLLNHGMTIYSVMKMI